MQSLETIAATQGSRFTGSASGLLERCYSDMSINEKEDRHLAVALDRVLHRHPLAGNIG